jgi:hypothetical protein
LVIQGALGQPGFSQDGAETGGLKAVPVNGAKGGVDEDLSRRQWFFPGSCHTSQYVEAGVGRQELTDTKDR